MAHITSKEIVRKAMKNIYKQVEKVNRNYFESQVDVLLVFSLMIDIGLPQNFFYKLANNLLELAYQIYEVDLNSKILTHSTEDYYTHEVQGSYLNSEISIFINRVNILNTQKFKETFNNEVARLFDERNYKACSLIINNCGNMIREFPQNYQYLFIGLFDEDIETDYWNLVAHLVDLGWDDVSFTFVDKTLKLLMNNARDFFERRRVSVLTERHDEAYYHYSLSKEMENK